MRMVSVAEAKSHLSAILVRVENGEQIMITRHGQAIAKIVQATPEKKSIDFSKIDLFRKQLPVSSSSASLIRKMRDSRY